MIFRTKTSKQTMQIYEFINTREHLQPFALAKISIALAIRSGYRYNGSLSDSAGLDLNRQTITGEYDLLFKKLIELNEEKSLSDEEYFPNYIKAYLDYGASLLAQEYKYTNDIYTHLVELEKSI